MRIVGNIDHPVLKITIFRNDDRLSLKLESGLYEQTYKFRDGEGVSSVEDVHRFVDEAFIAQVSDAMQQMHQSRIAALARCNPVADQDEFDVIL